MNLIFFGAARAVILAQLGEPDAELCSTMVAPIFPREKT